MALLITEINATTGETTQREAADGEIHQYTPDVVVPASVSPIQAMTALDNAGLLSALDAYMQDASTPLLARRAYLMATEWRRDSLLVMNAAIVLGLTEKQVDDLFISASLIKV